MDRIYIGLKTSPMVAPIVKKYHKGLDDKKPFENLNQTEKEIILEILLASLNDALKQVKKNKRRKKTLNIFSRKTSQQEK